MKKILSIAGIVAIMATGASALGLNAKVDYLSVNNNKLILKDITTYSLTIGNKNLYANGWTDSFDTNKFFSVVNINHTAYGFNAGGQYKNLSLNAGYQYEKTKINYNGDIRTYDFNFYSILLGTSYHNFDFKIGGIFGDKSDDNIYVAKATYLMPVQDNLSIQPSIWVEKNDKRIGDKTNDKTNFNASLSVKYQPSNNLDFIVGAKGGWQKAKITDSITVIPFYEDGNNGFVKVGYKLNKFKINAGLKVGEINNIDKNTGDSKTATATTISLGINYNF